MSQKERELTPAEQKRKAEFALLCEKMEKNGYQRRDLTIGVVKANFIAVAVMLPFMAVEIVGFFLALPEGRTASLGISMGSWLGLCLALLLLCAVHEAIHGLFWGICAKKHFHSIRFGIILSALTPYCTCSETLTKGQYVVGAAMPTVLLGFLPAGVAAGISSPWLLCLSVFMTLGGGADFYVIMRMLCYRPKQKEVLFYDHPYECGVVAFVR